MKVTYIEGERIQIAEESSSGVPGPLDNSVRSIGANGAADVDQVLQLYEPSSNGAEQAAEDRLKMRSSILLLVSLRLSFAMVGRHHRDGGFLNHVQLVHEFRCSAPQPRAVPVTELLTVGPSPDEFFYPASTVLTRCDGAGCCPDPRQICAPVETRNVSLVFMVKHMIDRQRDRHHEVVHALEHTKCGCVDKKLIKFD